MLLLYLLELMIIIYQISYDINPGPVSYTHLDVYKRQVLGYDDLDSYRRNPAHFGAPIGRNANRIGGAVITIGGRDYKLEANNGPNNLHSGPCLLYTSRILIIRR